MLLRTQLTGQAFSENDGDTACCERESACAGERVRLSHFESVREGQGGGSGWSSVG